MISTCKSIAREHIILRYNVDAEHFEALFLQPTGLNNTTADVTKGFLKIGRLDQIHFFCASCYMPHLYYIVLPQEDPSVQNQLALQTKD